MAKKKPAIPVAYVALKTDHPKKKRSLQSPNHKDHSRWFQGRASWPWREAPIETLVEERARARATLPEARTETDWELMGPTNVGGRMTAVVCHPADPDSVLAGAAGGGVWRSRDAGRNWEALWHDQPSLNVGSLAIDPTDPNVVYCGTGEANLSADSYSGVGIFRTTNGGDTWMLLAPAENFELPTRIGAIAIDPLDSSHLRIGGIGYMNDRRSGMYTSHDGGVTWAKNEFVASGNYWCHDVAFDLGDPYTIYATVTARGIESGIYKSSDAGHTWRQLSEGLPFSALIGRTSLAVAPSDPSRVYALMARSGDRGGALLGVYRSDDRGESWREITGRGFRGERQMSYNNTLAVHPTDPDHLICAGVDVHLTTNGGKNWKRVSSWQSQRGNPDFCHADHHKIAFSPADPNRVFSLNDGGVDVSDDGGRTWANRSEGLSVTMYYDLDVSQADPALYGGGCQDNGTCITTSGAPDDHFDVTGGDGGWIVFDPTNPNRLLASIYNFNIFRFRDGAWTDISPPADDKEKGSIWMCYIALDPADPKRIFTGTHRVWHSPDDGESWEAISPTLDGSPITALEIARDDPKRIYAATENGGFFRSTDGGEAWSPDLQGQLPGFTITRVLTRPDDADSVLVTVANFGHSHVFASRDGGFTWHDADGGQLPDVPHHALAIPAADPDRVYVGNDAGVFASPDFGQTWLDLSRNLPNAMVVDLVLHETDQTLTAATYGRSLWKLKTPETLEI